MKFETTPAFDADYRKLRAEHRVTFKDVVRTKFVPACDAHAADPATPWPRSLRVKSVRGAPGILDDVVLRQPRRAGHIRIGYGRW